MPNHILADFSILDSCNGQIGGKSLNEFWNENHSVLPTVLPPHLQSPGEKSDRVSRQPVLLSLSKLCSVFRNGMSILASAGRPSLSL